MKQDLIDFAISLGFHDLRITGPQLDSISILRHKSYLKHGWNARLEYLARHPEARYDACSLLPGCRSVIVAAVPYPNRTSSGHEAGRSRVSCYAWGEDYHIVVKDKLSQLGSWIDQRIPGHRWKATVDTSPVAEKAFAVAAGLGWQGSNSLVVREDIGTYFFIGLLLTTEPFEADTCEVKDGCVGCDRCIKSCPTQAIRGDGQVDANRCISYWNTSLKGQEVLLPDLSGWIFGCDVCQMVCPHNQERITAGTWFHPQPEIAGLEPKDILELDEYTFHKLTDGTALAHIGLDQLKNIAGSILQAGADSG